MHVPNYICYIVSIYIYKVALIFLLLIKYERHTHIYIYYTCTRAYICIYNTLLFLSAIRANPVPYFFIWPKKIRKNINNLAVENIISWNFLICICMCYLTLYMPNHMKYIDRWICGWVRHMKSVIWHSNIKTINKTPIKYIDIY